MKSVIILLVSTLVFILSSCKENTNTPTATYSVSGQVISQGSPVINANVIIDNFTNLQTQTDSLGSFEITSVPQGAHKLKVTKENGDGSFLERTYDISVENDLELDVLTLPIPVHLYDAENITATTVDIKWSQTDAADFREYKVYKHTTPGLDETTGELIYVSLSKDDTSYTIPDLNPLTEYFFRVFVMNDYGKLGGSNIVSATTQNLELIDNGSFESLNQSSGYPISWQAYFSVAGYYFVDSTISQEGMYSIRIENAPGVNYYYQWVDANLIVPYSTYRLTYWIKHEALNTGDEFAVFINDVEFNWHIIVNTVRGPALSSDWQMYDYEFEAPELNTAKYSFGFYFYIEGGKKAWLDNISLEKVN